MEYLCYEQIPVPTRPSGWTHKQNIGSSPQKTGLLRHLDPTSVVGWHTGVKEWTYSQRRSHLFSLTISKGEVPPNTGTLTRPEARIVIVKCKFTRTRLTGDPKNPRPWHRRNHASGPQVVSWRPMSRYRPSDVRQKSQVTPLERVVVNLGRLSIFHGKHESAVRSANVY